MKILHTESSPGWGGQELRILREAEGMRARGHEVVLLVQKNGGLVEPARKSGLTVYETEFKKSRICQILWELGRIICRHRIQIINTHSSLDAWLGGLIGKVMRRHVIRTRHLSTPIRSGLNSWLLYNFFADDVVTTCEEVVDVIVKQAKLPLSRCRSIPTGLDPRAVEVCSKQVSLFREKLGVTPDEILVGTLCVLRGWKGVADMLEAAKLLEKEEKLKWIIVGEGASESYFKQEWTRLGLQDRVIFTGHITPPFTALAAMDIFTLLSWANEGVSQASLQAAWLKKPLVMTPTGGLKEVCLDGETGLRVACRSPAQVSQAIQRLCREKELRKEMGEKAHRLVQSRFLLEHTLNQMEELY
ncbi:MAG: glycosyltransferase family 4 protein [Chlamydiales bacterium]